LAGRVNRAKRTPARNVPGWPCGARRALCPSTVTVAPISSTIRSVPSEVILDVDDGMKGRCAVNLHNAVTISQERLGRRVCSLNADRMHEVCSALRFPLGCG
jgi:mRNA-degrading endonuclease toxin of MazEF toxin-antitoxin module